MKRFSAVCILMLFLLSLCIPVSAEDTSQLGFVTDLAGLLTEEQVTELETEASRIADAYGCGLYILTVEDYTYYAQPGDDCFDFAMSVYSTYDMGLGPEKNGQLLVLSMADRDYAICAYGAAAHQAFTDYGKEQLEQEFLDDFARNDWYQGFSDYLTYGEEYLGLAAQGSPVDVPIDGSGWVDGDDYGAYYGKQPPSPFACIFFIGILPAAVALIVCLILKGKMKTAVLQKNADAYMRPNGLLLRTRIDQYTHTTEHRERINTDSHGGGRSGGTTINSSGFSGHSGKF